MQTTTTKEQKLMQELKELDTDDLVTVWNMFCNESGLNECIYSMGELDDVLYGCTPSEVLAHIDESFSFWDDYFWPCGLALTSGSSKNAFSIDMDKLTSWMVEHSVEIADVLGF